MAGAASTPGRRRLRRPPRKGSECRTSSTVPPELAVSRQAPDRNLALELVRVTEAAAMAAGRWVGSGDKNSGDGAAVDAMRALIGTVSMRGVVVIGEGEKDEAPMLYNGEEVGDGTGAQCDVAVDPIDGTTLMAKGMPNSIAVIAVVRARHHVRPVRRVLHGEDRDRGGVRRRHRHHRAGGREHLPRGEGQARLPRRRHRLHPRPPPPRGARPPGPRHRRADQVHQRRRRRGRDQRRPPRHRRRPAARHRRDAGGHHRRRRAALHGRRHPGQAVAAPTTTSGSVPSTPGTTWTAC